MNAINHIKGTLISQVHVAEALAKLMQLAKLIDFITSFDLSDLESGSAIELIELN